MEWLESKDKGQINRVNVKHILGDFNSAMEGTEVCVKFSSRRYRAKIIDLLEWQPRKKRRRKNKDTGLDEQPPRSIAKKSKASKGSAKKSEASKGSAKKSEASKGSAKKSEASKSSTKTSATKKNAVNKPLWLASGSPAKSTKKAEDAETRNGAEIRAVSSEITNTPQLCHTHSPLVCLTHGDHIPPTMLSSHRMNVLSLTRFFKTMAPHHHYCSSKRSLPRHTKKPTPK